MGDDIRLAVSVALIVGVPEASYDGAVWETGRGDVAFEQSIQNWVVWCFTTENGGEGKIFIGPGRLR